MRFVQKQRQGQKRADVETIELPTEPASDTSAAAELVEVINEVLGDDDDVR